MKRPCHNCPFRSDRPFRGLRREKAAAIAHGLMADDPFYCHQTYSNARPNKSSRLCTGAGSFLETVRPGGMTANLCFRLSRREITPEMLDRSVPVYSTIEAFIEGASS